MRAFLFAFAILGVVAGCGNDNVHHLNDGGADAPRSIDAPGPQPDAPPTPGLVTVTVTDQGSGVSGVQVYFQNADSSLVAGGSAMTDGSGVASATMGPGGFVTVLEPQLSGGVTSTGPAPQGATSVGVDNQGVVTWAGVKPGDNLRDDLDPIVTQLSDSSTFNLTVPTDPNASTSQYFLFTTCETNEVFITPPAPLRGTKRPAAAVGNNPPVNINLFACGGSADLFVETLDVDSNPLDTLFVPGVTIADGSDVTLTGTYVPFSSVPVAFTDAPAEYPDIEVDQELFTTRGFLFDADNDFDVSSGNGSGSLLVPALGSGTIAATELSLREEGTVFDEQFLTSWGVPPAAIAADVGSARLKTWVTQAQVDTIDELVVWAVANAGQQPDYLYAEVFTDRFDSANDTTDSWDWQIVTPGDADGSLAFPALPTDVFDFAFRDTDEVSLENLFGIQSPGGYDAARDSVIDDVFGVTEDASFLALTEPPGQVTAQIARRFEGDVARGNAMRRHAHPTAKRLHHRVSVNGKAVR